MTKKRFYYAHSTVYGWCVYDRAMGNVPAYEACSELLPLKSPHIGNIVDSPILIEKEHQALRLSAALNAVYETHILKK